MLAKLAQHWALVLVIVPCWQALPWYPQFVRLVKPGKAPLLIPAHQHLLQLPGTNLQHPIWDWFSLVAAILLGTSQQGYVSWLDHIIRAALRVCAQSAYNTPVQKWLDFWNRRQLNPCQPTVSQVFDLLHTLYEFGLSYSDILKCNKCNSRDLRSPKARATLVSVSVYERNLSPETSTTKIHQHIGC